MIQVIERFHQILKLCAETPMQAVSLSAIAEHLRISSSAAANIVRSMVELGYLQAQEKRRGYVLGVELSRLSMATPYRYLTEAAEPLMSKLAQRYDVLVVLVTEGRGKRIELLRMEGEDKVIVKAKNDRAKSLSLFHCATGLLFLGAMKEKRLLSLWESEYGTNNLLKIEEQQKFMTYCRKLLNDGSVVINVHLSGGMSAAYPIFLNGRLVAAVGIMSHKQDQCEEMVAGLKDVAICLNDIINQ